MRENVKEFTGECNRAVRELAEEGVGMIILSSYGYSEEVKELVKEYPEIVFYVFPIKSIERLRNKETGFYAGLC